MILKNLILNNSFITFYYFIRTFTFQLIFVMLSIENALQAKMFQINTKNVSFVQKRLFQ